MTSSSTRGDGAASTSSSNASSEEENRKLNFDLEILSWRVSRFVEKLNAQLHFDWIVLGHAESVSIRRKGLETFIDEEEEEEDADEEKEEEEYVVEEEKDASPLKIHCEGDTNSEIPVKKRKLLSGETPRGASTCTDVGSGEDDVVKRSDPVSDKETSTLRNSYLPSSTPPPPSPPSLSPLEDKGSQHDQTTSKLNANEKTRGFQGTGRGRGASSSGSKCTKHKSINFGKSSSSVTIVANAIPLVANAATIVSNNTIIDLTDISPNATTPSNNVQNTINVIPTPINPSSINLPSIKPPTNLSSAIPPPAPPPPAPDQPRRKPFQCSFCPFSTERSLNLQNHQLTHADFLPQNKNAVGGVVGATVSGSFVGTGRNLPTESAEDVTTPDHDDEDDEDDVQAEEPSGLLSCTECEYTTVQISQLNRHMLLHSDVRPYTCDKCDFACNTSLNLDIHMQSHAGGDPSKSNELEQLLDSNLGSAPAKQSFSITDFDLSFLTAPGAAAAAAGINGPAATNNGSNGVNAAISPSSSNGSSEENPYRCGRCSYSSKNLNDLKQHFGSHVGEALKAPLKCTKCNFSCNESSQLREHFQAVHAKKTSSEIC